MLEVPTKPTDKRIWMNLHSCARSCPRSRELLVNRILEQGWTVKTAAEAAGLSERTAYKWLKRFREEGVEGLRDRSSRPRTCPHQTPARVVERIVELRKKRLLGREIARRVRRPHSTVARILASQGLGRLTALEPKPPVVRYEHPEPGDMLHLDIKKLGKFTGAGHRRTDLKSDWRTGGRGWEFVHVCVDDHSRVAYLEVLEDERQESAVEFLRRTVAWYRARGVTVRRVLTDNGSCYRSRACRATCAELGIKHCRTRPYSPQTNGKAERFIQSMLRECAYGRTYTTSGHRRLGLKAWVRRYNLERPHASLGFKPPASRLPAMAS